MAMVTGGGGGGGGVGVGGGGGGGGGGRGVNPPVFGTEFADILSGKQVFGLGGNDVITGTGDASYLDGGAGNDTITGTIGGDFIVGGLGSDIIDGGLGIDELNYLDAIGGVTLNLQVTTAQNTGVMGIDTVRNIENITGSQFADNFTAATTAVNPITGQLLGSTIYGMGGNDIITGSAGIDFLFGGNGDDRV